MFMLVYADLSIDIYLNVIYQLKQWSILLSLYLSEYLS